MMFKANDKVIVQTGKYKGVSGVVTKRSWVTGRGSMCLVRFFESGKFAYYFDEKLSAYNEPKTISEEKIANAVKTIMNNHYQPYEHITKKTLQSAIRSAVLSGIALTK